MSFNKTQPVVGVVEQSANFGSVEAVAESLFTTYLYPFELTSILLLAAIVGAVVMAKRANEDEPLLEDMNEGEE